MALGSWAHRLYAQGTPAGQDLELIPRSKFNFTVSMTHHDPDDERRGKLITTVFDRISSMSMPGYATKSATMNQYNKKRVVQTGIDYSPITMIAYDTKDCLIEKFLKDYSDYYYAGSMNYGSSFVAFSNANAGTILNQDKNFINTLTIFRENGLYDKNIINVYNPMITNIDADNLDYSDSGLVQYRITFIYEGYNIETENKTNNQKITELPKDIKTDVGDTTVLPNNSPVVKSPSEPDLFEQQDDLVDTTAAPVDDEIVDNRLVGEAVGQTQVDASNISEDRQYENLGYAFLDDTIEPGETISAEGQVYEAVPTDDPNSPVRFEPVGTVVDNSAVSQSTVLAERKNPETGAPVEQVVERTQVSADGTQTSQQVVVPVKEPEYRVYDQYVGMDINEIPEQDLYDAANSGAYYETGEGTLANYADDPTHDEKMEEFLNPSTGYVSTHTSTTGNDDYYIGYNPEQGYQNFKTNEEAQIYASGNSSTQDMVDETQVMSQSVAPRMTEDELRLQGSMTPMPASNQDLQNSIARRRLNPEAQRMADGFVAGQAGARERLENSKGAAEWLQRNTIDEGQVMSQSVAPSMSEEELRRQGSMTPMPAPNPDLIAKADSFDSDGDPINNTNDSEE